MDIMNISKGIMESICRIRWSSLPLFGAIILYCTFADNSTANAWYRVTDLGTIGTGASGANSINDNGEVVGKVTNSETGEVSGFFWSPSSGMSTLSSLGGDTRGNGIDNNGSIAGVSNDHAVLWNDSGATPLDIGTLGGETSYAWSIENNGQIVGWADMPEYENFTVFHAYLYDGGTLTDIGTLASDQEIYYGGFSTAYDVNTSGKVVGTANTDGWYYHAYVWDQDSGMVDLGTHPENQSFEGYATAINNSGDLIAGLAKDSSGNSYPMVWRNGSTIAELIPTLDNFPYAEFYDMNERGEIIGIMWNADENEHALIYDSGNGVRDLNDLIPADTGWELVYATAINEAGQISGKGILNGNTRAFLLTPFSILTVDRSGTGGGSVTPDSGSITWNDISGTGEYERDSEVTLTAAADPYSSFAGWTGACESNANPCIVTMSSDQSVTAIFDRIEDFTAEPVSGPVPLYVCFTDKNSSEHTAWQWSFGDGAVSSSRNPCHEYNTSGNFTVSLTATAAEGSINMTKNNYINTYACPNQPAWISGTSFYYGKIGDACSIAVNGDTIRLQGLEFTENLVISGDGSVTIAGGFVCDFSENPMYSTIRGTITIVGGTSVIDKVVIL